MRSPRWASSRTRRRRRVSRDAPDEADHAVERRLRGALLPGPQEAHSLPEDEAGRGKVLGLPARRRREGGSRAEERVTPSAGQSGAHRRYTPGHNGPAQAPPPATTIGVPGTCNARRSRPSRMSPNPVRRAPRGCRIHHSLIAWLAVQVERAGINPLSRRLNLPRETIANALADRPMIEGNAALLVARAVAAGYAPPASSPSEPPPSPAAA